MVVELQIFTIVCYDKENMVLMCEMLPRSFRLAAVLK